MWLHKSSWVRQPQCAVTLRTSSFKGFRTLLELYTYVFLDVLELLFEALNPNKSDAAVHSHSSKTQPAQGTDSREAATSTECRSLAFVIDKNVAVEAIPEENYVFLVLEVDVGSREHVRVQAAETQTESAGLTRRRRRWGPAGGSGGSRERPDWAGGRTWSRSRRTRSSRARAEAAGAPPAAPSSGWAAAGGSPPAARQERRSGRRQRRGPVITAPPPTRPVPGEPPQAARYRGKVPLQRGSPVTAGGRGPLQRVTPRYRGGRRSRRRAGPTLLSVSFLSLGRSRRSSSAAPVLPSVPAVGPVPGPAATRTPGPAEAPRRSLGLAFSLSSFIPIPIPILTPGPGGAARTQ